MKLFNFYKILNLLNNVCVYNKYGLNKKIKIFKQYSPKYVYFDNMFLYNNSFSNILYLNLENKNNIKKFEMFFYNYVKNNGNFIFFDTNYHYAYNLYSLMFINKGYLYNKDYFFIQPKYFTFKNWIYYFNIFCETNDVNLLIITDFKKYGRFLKSFYPNDFLLLTYQPVNFLKLDSDFYFYLFEKNFILQKYLYNFFIVWVFYTAFNDRCLIYKNNFYNNFYKFYIN